MLPHHISLSIFLKVYPFDLNISQCLVSTVVIKKYRTLNGSKRQRFIMLEFCRDSSLTYFSLVKIKASAGAFHAGG